MDCAEGTPETTPETRLETWDALMEIEPLLGELLTEAEAVRDDGSAPEFCAVNYWYGWEGCTGLHSRTASWVFGDCFDVMRRPGLSLYRVAMNRIFHSLPPCRHARGA